MTTRHSCTNVLSSMIRRSQMGATHLPVNGQANTHVVGDAYLARIVREGNEAPPGPSRDETWRRCLVGKAATGAACRVKGPDQAHRPWMVVARAGVRGDGWRCWGPLGVVTAFYTRPRMSRKPLNPVPAMWLGWCESQSMSRMPFSCHHASPFYFC